MQALAQDFLALFPWRVAPPSPFPCGDGLGVPSPIALGSCAPQLSVPAPSAPALGAPPPATEQVSEPAPAPVFLAPSSRALVFPILAIAQVLQLFLSLIVPSLVVHALPASEPVYLFQPTSLSALCAVGVPSAIAQPLQTLPYAPSALCDHACVHV